MAERKVFNYLSVLLYTCPQGQAQDRLVHRVFETEVWNDLQVVDGMKCIGCKTIRKKKCRYILGHSSTFKTIQSQVK